MEPTKIHWKKALELLTKNEKVIQEEIEFDEKIQIHSVIVFNKNGIDVPEHLIDYDDDAIDCSDINDCFYSRGLAAIIPMTVTVSGLIYLDKRMKIIVSYIFVFFVCTNFGYSQIKDTTIKCLLKINTEKVNYSNSKIDITLSFKNISDEKIILVKHFDLKTDSLSICKLVIKNVNGDCFSDRRLVQRRMPQKSDYIKLKPNESLSYTKTIDLKCITRFDQFEQINTHFGIYFIKVVFNDRYLKKKNAFKYVESNEVKIEYVND
jgi:hypothetical protein